ncbi:MAG: DMT family transporter [Thermoguttaceae bacterium]|nr:DMT family transporter [Thermoguttaceae bacterium]
MTTSTQAATPSDPSQAAPNESLQGFRLSDSAKGTIYCILADTIFSFSYFFVRVLTGMKVHGDWTFCMKETVTTLGALPIFLYLWYRGKCAPPPIKIICLILIAAFFCEFVGVRAHISAFSAIGIMLGNPLIRTFTILGTALIGIFALRERITGLKLVTMGVLICAIFILGFSQQKKPVPTTANATPVSKLNTEKSETVKSDMVKTDTVKSDTTKKTDASSRESVPEAKPVSSPIIPGFMAPMLHSANAGLARVGISLSPLFLFGLIMALVTGTGYAIYTVLLRLILRKAASEDSTAGKAEKKPVSVFFIVSAVCGFGAIVGALCLFKDRGWNGFTEVPSQCWIYVGLAGAMNVVCFGLKNLSLRYATASKVAIFSVLQIFLATIFGLLCFGEAANVLVYTGLALIVLGIVLASKTN